MPLDCRMWTSLFLLDALRSKSDLLIQNWLVLLYTCEKAVCVSERDGLLRIAIDLLPMQILERLWKLAITCRWQVKRLVRLAYRKIWLTLKLKWWYPTVETGHRISAKNMNLEPSFPWSKKLPWRTVMYLPSRANTPSKGISRNYIKCKDSMNI